MQPAPQVTLADTLRSLRRAAGMSQGALAAASGITVPTIQNIESGRRSRFRRTTLRLLAEALDVPVEKLTDVA